MEGDDNNQATNSGDSPDDPSSSSKSFNIDDQFETIRNAVNRAEMREGDTWYIVDSRWFKQWKRYVGWDAWDQSSKGNESAMPGPIDNSNLLTESGSLKQHLTETFDFVLLSEIAWKHLVSWFGVVDGQSPVERTVIQQGLYVKSLKVEVYLTEVKLNVYGRDKKDEVKATFSRAEKLRNVIEYARKALDVDSDKEVRVWSRYMSSFSERLDKYEDTLQDHGIYSGQALVFELKNDDGTWPKQTELSSSSYSSSNYGSYSSSSYQSKVDKGLTGLSNLGNTCFMNSALQCLSNVPTLTEYFLTNEYKGEINRDNPLGMRGHLAESYGELMHDMWSERAVVAPRRFKSEVGKFAPRFLGYQQHDSQELLAFLLDGLHEDLNRVIKKPYVEMKDSDGRPDEEVAAEAWENHQKRNRSIVVDFIQGQYKSTLVCPDCDKVSVTFDPFMYLTLPLPVKKTKRIALTLVRQDPTVPPKKYRVSVRKNGFISDISDELEKMTGIPSKLLVITDIYAGKMYKIFHENDGISSIYTDRDNVHAYELPVHDVDDDKTALVVFYHRTWGSYGSSSCFGLPMVLGVPRRDTTYRLLYERIVGHMKVSETAKEDGIVQGEEEKISIDENENEKGSNPETNATGRNEALANGQNAEAAEEQMQDDGTVENEKTNDDEKDVDESESMEVDPLENVHKTPDVVPDNRNKKRLLDIATSEEPEDHQKREEETFLFRMTYVNSYGSSDIGEIDKENPIRFKKTTYVALDWTSEGKKSYDEDAANNILEDESWSAKPAATAVPTLHDCIKLFTEKETLSEEDPWYCSKCKEHRQADKTMTLWKLPEVLVVHLKRFSYSRYWRDKLDTYVEFPIENLDMREFVQGPTDGKPMLYDLCAVSNHYGGLGGGHYTAYCKNKTTGDWYHFDDSSVTRVENVEATVRSRAAYLLIYLHKKKDDKQVEDMDEGVEDASRSEDGSK
ncbi:ubiquitin carboxyl-terminal hydrolase 15-like isoform X2 [Oscarella lobularis]|uniref:ubiquitin carboxyl-terminal hydrolase 15-like isoform X2 n=1 Tax=Oscarella lobularis TaxID=121494 RepID=UPI0033138778